MACRARKTVLWLVCKDPSRSLLGASAYHVSSSLSCAVRRLGEVRPPISTPVRLFPAVGRWGSPRRCAHPHAPSGDAHQQNHRRKKRTLMGGLSAAAAASRKPSSLQRKKKGLSGGLHMLFLEYSESDNYSEMPCLGTTASPAGCYTNNTMDCLFSRT